MAIDIFQALLNPQQPAVVQQQPRARSDALERALMQQAMQGSIRTPLEGFGKLAQMWTANRVGERYRQSELDREQAAADKQDQLYQAMASALSDDDPSNDFAAIAATRDPALIRHFATERMRPPSQPAPYTDPGKLKADLDAGYLTPEQYQQAIGNVGQPDATALERNLIAAGLQPGTPEFQTAMMDAINKPSVSIDQRAESAGQVEMAKNFAKRYDEINNQANNAYEMLGMYDAAERAINSGVYTGPGGGAMLELQRIGASLGITNVEQAAAGELLQAIQNRAALLMRNPQGGMGMPGALSDKDIAFLKAAQVGINNTPEGNRLMLSVLRALEQRKIEIGILADEYITENGQLDAGFNARVRQYAQENSLFGEQEGGGMQPDAAPIYAVNPETGERVEWRDGQWVPVVQ